MERLVIPHHKCSGAYCKFCRPYIEEAAKKVLLQARKRHLYISTDEVAMENVPLEERAN